MTLRHLKIYKAVAETESVTKAAQQLYLSQPSVSVAIKELERYYGIRLFERLNQRLKITQDGIRFLNYVTHIIDLFEEADKSFRAPGSTGPVKIGASVTAGACFVPGIMTSFTAAYPDVQIYTRVGASGEIEQDILSNNLDIGVVEGVVHSDYIVQKVLKEDELVAVCSGAHPFARTKSVSLEQLVKQPLLLRERTSGTAELLLTALSARGYTVNPVLESTSVEALKNTARRNLGIAFLPEPLVKAELEAGILYRVPVRDFSVKRCYRLIYHKNKYLSPLLLALMQRIEQEVKQTG